MRLYLIIFNLQTLFLTISILITVHFLAFTLGEPVKVVAKCNNDHTDDPYTDIKKGASAPFKNNILDMRPKCHFINDLFLIPCSKLLIRIHYIIIFAVKQENLLLEERIKNTQRRLCIQEGGSESSLS